MFSSSSFLLLPLLLLAATAASAGTAAAVPRSVVIAGQQFVNASTSLPFVMSGPNVVVKASPYLPSVEGAEVCNDVVNDECAAAGNCTTCLTFNEADVANLRARGWNAIRLGVVWAGAQPEDGDTLDGDFLERLHAILDLCDRSGIAVVLDNHGDMVGSAGCGNGVPVWFHAEAAQWRGVELGKPLVTGLPYSLVPSLRVDAVGGYDHCGADNEEAWGQYAGDPNYNLLNECCLAMNSPNPGGLGWTTASQAAMDYLVEEGSPGRDKFVRFWRLMAEAVAGHPSAFAVELMNEPMTIRRRDMFQTWRAVAEAVNAVVPDMAVSLSDVGEGAVLPAWVTEHAAKGAGVAIDQETVDWIKNSSTLYYAWHWYGAPADAAEAVANVQAISADWDVPSFATEFGSCEAWKAAAAANISHTYWHYSSYCNTGPSFGNRSVPDETFGGCILGWAGASSSYSCD